ncbi:hypothetical protein MSG28_001231 [Choristoneura fumiferana]|uniref:Uncharacterized protein n=1 Tax=Choristoneura fumiferana TaxID=7141 RepID=A0ACC0K451_CHOFU|nr:hypothetical protein MSG28_001231 [Choristoneura fumiferana]
MSCCCRGAKFKSCSCGVLRNGPWGTEPIFMDSACLRYQIMYLKICFARIVEGLYEKCAAYNLRYCPYRTFCGSKNSVMRTMKDFIVLAFFLMANFIVFLTILTKIAMHMSCAIIESGNWIKRSVCTSRCEQGSLNSPACSLPQEPRILNCS